MGEVEGGALLSLSGVSKRFGALQALSNVGLRVERGRVLGLVGENGAGKSTLLRIIAGVTPPDQGEMRLSGRPFAPADPRAAAKAGVSVIHQELNVFENLTVAENLFVGRLPHTRWGAVDRKTLTRRASAALARVGLDCEPSVQLERLSPGERQLVEIARAIERDAAVVIFDEPTTSLSAKEARRLFALIAELRAAGKGVIYVSHALEDVLALADDVVVLRDGQVVGDGPAKTFEVAGLITRMVGRPLEQLFPRRSEARPSRPVVLEVSRLGRRDAFAEVSFEVREGEIVGIAGLMGSGRTELLRVLFGLDRETSGTVRYRGALLGNTETRQRIDAGMAFVTEDRRGDGVLLDDTVAHNVSLAALVRWCAGWGWVERVSERREVRSACEGVALSAASNALVSTLSGGNQQKVVLAKWLATKPKLLLLDEPTRGIDVGAKLEIYNFVVERAEQSAAVVVVSSELEELLGLCDRILVMHRGRLVGQVERAAFDRERLLSMAMLGTVEEVT